MWFLAPGLFVWIGAAIWWAKRRTIWLPLVVQLVGGFGVAIGGLAAYMAGVASSSAGMIDAGFWDPSVDAGNQAFVAEIAVIAWVAHWALLTGSLIMTIATNKRRTKNAQQAEDGDASQRPC